MNDINEMPPKCQYCPYWEVCKYPWVCPDIEDKKPKRTDERTETHARVLIDRHAAIDAVKKNTFRLTFAEEQNCEGHLAWSANAVYSDVIEGALLELPSVQPEPRWVSCSERLPFDAGYYLTTTIYNEVFCDYWNLNEWNRTEQVIAWMPLPEPYKGDDK